MVFLATASVVVTFRAYERGRWGDFILAGLSTATKYTGALSALPLVAVPLPEMPDRRPWRKACVGLVSLHTDSASPTHSPTCRLGGMSWSSCRATPSSPWRAHPDRYLLLSGAYLELFSRCQRVAVFGNPWFE